MELLLKRYLKLCLFLIITTTVSLGQSQPYLSAPVNGSTWETATPTLYWWYVPTPYIYGPYNYSVQVSASYSDFSESKLLVDAEVSAYGAGNYPINNSVGLIQGVTYYWRVGVNGNFSSVWYFTPSGSGSVTTYTINASAAAHGSISPSGTTTLARGSNQTFSIVPNSGYSIEDVLVDDVSVGALSSYTFENITTNHTISASFVFIPVFDTTFVSILGSDADGNGSRAKPYRHIQRGLDKTKPGHFVFVFDGVYEEDLVLTKPVKIIGEVKPSTRSFQIETNDVTIKNFKVAQSSPGPGIQKKGIESYYHRDKLTIENVDVYTNAEFGLLLENIDSVEVKDCNFYKNNMGGVAIFFCNHLTFDNVGIWENLRGFAAYNSNYISINNLFSSNNGKAYPDYHPDENGFTFQLCNDIEMNNVIISDNDDQGLKFEDCSRIGMNIVNSCYNKTDGMAFIESDHISFNTGASYENGSTEDDNGIEVVFCDNMLFSNVAANDNSNNGILFDLHYKGVYQWDPSIPIPSPLPDTCLGQTTNVSLIDVSARLNGKHGLYGLHMNNFNFSKPDFSENAESGLELDAAQSFGIVDGTFDGNKNGIVLKPTINVHKIAQNLGLDDIYGFSLMGVGSISNNSENGILMLTEPYPGYSDSSSRITRPLFYGSFKVIGNGLVGLNMSGFIEKPVFSGLYFQSTNSRGVQITDLTDDDYVSDVKINDCYFDGYANNITRYAIALTDGTLYSKDNVDAKNNVFVGATGNAFVENRIYHKVDDALLGLVTTTGWTNGNPSVIIGSASAYIGNYVTIPVTLNINAVPLGFTFLSGKITFDEHKIRYKGYSTGTGTIFNNANWATQFRHVNTDELEFISVGFSDSEINYSGVLFTLTFEVAAETDGFATVEGLASDWVNNGTIPLEIFNGTITYTSNLNLSLVKGDANLNGEVEEGDCLAIANHVSGITLTNQAYLNANVNKDNRVDGLDAADILFYINYHIWPASASPALADLTFATASIDQEGLLRFPITLYNCSNVRSIEVELSYDESKIDFRNFRQLMQGEGYYVEAKSVETGKTKLFFTSAENSNGTLVPAELYFNLKSNDNTAGLISSSYSVNGATSKQGPAYGSNTITGVDAAKEIPVSFYVEQNYPNPFNPSTTIKYALPHTSYVTVKIYDILGRLVNTLVNSEMPAGIHKVVWNGDDSKGAKVVSGPYFYQINSGSQIISKKMLLVK
ncbi:MAG: T9SS C-terminal target domain-containing protein [Ignavibacteriales bacterium]|nr:MAG: T9SS C-terminal target domain-containing protein [Ignavibacteriales bacterium]